MLRQVFAAALCVVLLIPGATPSAAQTTDATPTNPYSGQQDIISKGRTRFNVHCAHCHGPNAFQGERPRDLRRLKLRYGDEMTAVFLKTISNGRPEKGMPPWKGVIDDDEVWKIYTFLETVQK